MAKKPAKPPDRPDASIAILAPDQELHSKPLYYPERALRQREQGDRLVQVEESRPGKYRISASRKRPVRWT